MALVFLFNVTSVTPAILALLCPPFPILMFLTLCPLSLYHFLSPQPFGFPQVFFPPTYHFCGVGRDEMTFYFIKKWADISH